MPVHFPVKFIQQKSLFQLQHLIQGIHMKFIYVRLVGRGHPTIIGGKLRGLLSACTLVQLFLPCIKSSAVWLSFSLTSNRVIFAAILGLDYSVYDTAACNIHL